MNPGVGLADARERGWLSCQAGGRHAPWRDAVRGKVTAALPYAIVTLAGITLVARFTAGPLDVVQILRVIGVLVLGSLPFSLFSLAVGAKFSPTAAIAVLNGLLDSFGDSVRPLVSAGDAPGWLGEIAVYLPPYHLAQLALAQVEGGGAWGHVAYLLGLTIVGAIAGSVGVPFRGSVNDTTIRAEV